MSDDGEVEVDSEKLNALRKIVMQAIEKRSAHAEEAQQESGARRPRLFPHFVDKRILAAPLVSSLPLVEFRPRWWYRFFAARGVHLTSLKSTTE